MLELAKKNLMGSRWIMCFALNCSSIHNSRVISFSWITQEVYHLHKWNNAFEYGMFWGKAHTDDTSYGWYQCDMFGNSRACSCLLSGHKLQAWCQEAYLQQFNKAFNFRGLYRVHSSAADRNQTDRKSHSPLIVFTLYIITNLICEWENHNKHEQHKLLRHGWLCVFTHFRHSIFANMDCEF